IGATTENPSFELNNALLSRARAYVLKPLGDAALMRILRHALETPVAFAAEAVGADDDALQLLVDAADGDARRALGLLELAMDLVPDTGGERHVSRDAAAKVARGGHRRFDR